MLESFPARPRSLPDSVGVRVNIYKFCDYDRKISRDELAAAAKAQTGMVPPDDMIDKIMASMDDDSNGSIS